MGNTAVPAPTPETKVAETPRELSVKEQIYQKIADMVKLKTGKNIGRTGGQDLFNLGVHEIFAAAAFSGAIRLNGGFGSLKVKSYTAGSRKLPSGAVTTFGERKKMRYEQGVSVTNLIAGKGEDPAAQAPVGQVGAAQPVVSDGNVDLP